MSSTALKTLVLPVLLTVAAFYIAYQFVDPAPPREVTITTGSPDGAYYNFALKYKELLARHDFKLVVQESHGSVENVNRLLSEAAHVGFVQGGTARRSDQVPLQTLGSLYYEPLWVFFRKDLDIRYLNELGGLKIFIGEQGSGTRSLVERLLSENEILDKVELVDELQGSYDSSFNDAKVDVVFLVASPESSAVSSLLDNDEVELLSFERAEAYQRRLRFLSYVDIPRGMINLRNDIPAQPIRLLAATANLVVHEDLHPAIQDLLLQAADEVHGDGGWFESTGEFPNAAFAEYPLSKEAKRFYEYGPPLLQRFLPFRLASLIDRLKVMILPLVVLMLPLMKIMPPIYTWRMRSKIYRWYQSLEKIDLANAKPEPDIAALRSQLDEIEQEVIHVHVPLSFASQLYDLHQHIELVKRRLGS
ncbi:MAG: TAXI family TRAP transporter solute-binding subunit [Gammaproteobacteria bacterium]